MTDIRAQVKTFIVNNFLFGDAGSLQDDTSFLESGIIDSTGILELVTFLEESFKIKVKDDELVPENLNSIAVIEAYLRRKRNGNE
jgi:acyl carrier protein